MAKYLPLNWKVGCSFHGHRVNRRNAPWARAFTSTAPARSTVQPLTQSSNLGFSSSKTGNSDPNCTENTWHFSLLSRICCSTHSTLHPWESEGGREDIYPLRIFLFFVKRMFWSFEWEKSNFFTFSPPWKNPLRPPWRESFRCPGLHHLISYYQPHSHFTSYCTQLTTLQ